MLELQHAYSIPPNAPTVALVDVNLILECLKGEDTHVGAWVNVVGYVGDVLKEEKRGVRRGQEKLGLSKLEQDRVRNGPRAVRVRVQAIMLWNAGGVKLGEYEKTLEERLKLEKGS